jgi:hypothetical protein
LLATRQRFPFAVQALLCCTLRNRSACEMRQSNLPCPLLSSCTYGLQVPVRRFSRQISIHCDLC